MSSQSGKDLNPEAFGSLLSIPKSSLVNLTMITKAEVLNTTSLSSRLVRRIGGLYNLVHIIQRDDFKLVIRIPATG